MILNLYSIYSLIHSRSDITRLQERSIIPLNNSDLYPSTKSITYNYLLQPLPSISQRCFTNDENGDDDGGVVGVGDGSGGGEDVDDDYDNEYDSDYDNDDDYDDDDD